MVKTSPKGFQAKSNLTLDTIEDILNSPTSYWTNAGIYWPAIEENRFLFHSSARLKFMITITITQMMSQASISKVWLLDSSTPNGQLKIVNEKLKPNSRHGQNSPRGLPL